MQEHENISRKTHNFLKMKLQQFLTKPGKDRYDIHDKKRNTVICKLDSNSSYQTADI